jgi:putative methyltransferase (TIGR04325 family)
MTNKLKKTAKLISPPILLESVRKLKRYFSRSHVMHYGAFEGPMSSWEEAIAHSDGWDASVITEKILASALKVRDGIAEFQQDTVIRDKILYSTTIVAFLLLALALSRQKGRLDIMDFGGSLGTNYFQYRKIIKQLHETPFKWNVIELPAIAQLGLRHFANANLNFFESLDHAINELGQLPDAFLFTGSLQYVAEPLSLIDKVISSGAKLLAFDRLLVAPTEEHAIFIQRPDPEIFYPSTYPVWCFSKDRFIEHLMSKRFILVEHFTLNPQAHFDHCGMIFTHDGKNNMIEGGLNFD